jgi:hypothetical protein
MKGENVVNKNSAAAIALFWLAAALPPQALFAQSNNDPVIILNATQQCKLSYSYKESVTNVDRIRYDLRYMKQDIEKCLTAPVSPREKQRGQWLLPSGLTRQEILDRLGRIDDAALEALVKKLAYQVAIHEGAHSCGVNGHLRKNNLKDRPKEAVDSEVRAVDCPMQYCSWGEKCRMLLFGEMFGDGRLCDAAPQHCWRNISPEGIESSGR